MTAIDPYLAWTFFTLLHECPKCGGEGSIFDVDEGDVGTDRDCDHCHGTGVDPNAPAYDGPPVTDKALWEEPAP